MNKSVHRGHVSVPKQTILLLVFLIIALLPVGAVKLTSGLSQTFTATSLAATVDLGPVDLTLEAGLPLIRTFYSPDKSLATDFRITTDQVLNRPLFNFRVMTRIVDFPDFVGKTDISIRVGLATDIAFSLGEGHDSLVGSYGPCLEAGFGIENFTFSYTMTVNAFNILLFVPSLRTTGGCTKYGYYTMGDIERGSVLFEELKEFAWWNNARFSVRYSFL